MKLNGAHSRHRDVPAAAGSERRGVFSPLRLGASGRMPESLFLDRAMKSRVFVACVLLLGTLPFGLPTSLADKNDKKNEHTLVREALQRGEVLPLVKILAIASQQVPGDVIEVELENEQGTLIYEIKILTGNGRVREVKIDARSGAVVEIEDD